jgi:hypothetical protein
MLRYGRAPACRRLPLAVRRSCATAAAGAGKDAAAKKPNMLMDMWNGLPLAAKVLLALLFVGGSAAEMKMYKTWWDNWY